MSAVRQFDAFSLSAALVEHDLVLVAFWAPWCGPCQAFAPVFEAVAEDNPDVLFGKINVDAEPELAARFGVRSIPMLMGVRQGVVLYKQPGGLSAGYLEALTGHLLAVDMDEVRAALPAAGVDQG